MKTIRNMVNPGLLFIPEIMFKLVQYFNTRINRDKKLMPLDMKIYPQLELMWINHCITYNERIKQLLIRNGFYNYKPGDKLYVHLDDSITPKNLKNLVDHLLLVQHF
jgi:hypothetical protein